MIRFLPSTPPPQLQEWLFFFFLKEIPPHLKKQNKKKRHYSRRGPGLSLPVLRSWLALPVSGAPPRLSTWEVLFFCTLVQSRHFDCNLNPALKGTYLIPCTRAIVDAAVQMGNKSGLHYSGSKDQTGKRKLGNKADCHLLPGKKKETQSKRKQTKYWLRFSTLPPTSSF